MFQILLFHNGEWFSTSSVSGIYGFTGDAMTRIHNAIQREVNYWKAPITWELVFDGINVTDEYLSLEVK